MSAAAQDAGGGLDPRFARPRTLFFGIGAQKSATSWLDKYLRRHPEVCLPVRKEQHYWSTRTPPGPVKRLPFVEARLAKVRARSVWKRLGRTRRGRALDEAWRRTAVMLRHDSVGHRDYADVLFQIYAGEPVAGEITPEYALLGAEVLREMTALGRDVRFIFIMRDPLDRLRSGLRMSQRKRHGAASVTPEGLIRRMTEVIVDPSDASMLRSRYDLTIRALDAATPPDKVCYLFYETMFDQSEMDRLADFLGIARRPAPVDRKVYASAHAETRFPVELESRAAETLLPVYDFVRARFGARVPEKWLAPAMAAGATA